MSHNTDGCFYLSKKVFVKAQKACVIEDKTQDRINKVTLKSVMNKSPTLISNGISYSNCWYIVDGKSMVTISGTTVNDNKQRH